MQANFKEIGPDDPCPCGSGRSLAECCLPRVRERAAQFRSEHQQRLNREAKEAPFKGPKGLSAHFKGRRIRVLWNRIVDRPESETFHEFLVCVLKWTFGEPWYKAELAKPPESRHVVMKWIFAWHEEARKHAPQDHVHGEVFTGVATGDCMELLALAEDIYRLRLVNELPDALCRRLRHLREFQGARYEVAIAAIFIRSAFDIEWHGEKSKTHCEFTATHRITKEKISVETKSRRRTGTINEPGDLQNTGEIEADVGRLYAEALRQRPPNRAFAIFVDVNVPPQPSRSGLSKTWLTDIKDIVDKYPECSPSSPRGESVWVLTNFAWHYGAEEVASPPESIFVIPKFAAHPIQNPLTFEALRRGVDSYGQIPDEE